MDIELTDAAKKAVRRYTIGLFVLPAIAVAVLSFLAGFAADKLLEAKAEAAESSARATYAEQLTSFIADASASATEARLTNEDVREFKTRITTMVEQSEAIIAAMDGKDELVEALTPILEESLKQQLAEVAALQLALTTQASDLDRLCHYVHTLFQIAGEPGRSPSGWQAWAADKRGLPGMKPIEKRGKNWSSATKLPGNQW